LRAGDGDHYVVSGRKIWTSTVQVASHILLVARIAPRGSGKRPIDGLTLFDSALDRSAIEVRRIPKMGREAVDSNMLFIYGLKIPAENRIGAEGDGLRLLLDGLNPERILVAAAYRRSYIRIRSHEVTK
jgi:acyl-CoA dehydrogenase